MRVKLISCVILAALLLAGCGNDDSSDNKQDGNETTTVVTEAMLAQDPELRIDETHYVLLTIETQQDEVDSDDLSGAGQDCYNFEVTKNMSVALNITSPNGMFSSAVYEAESPDALAEASEGQKSDMVSLTPNKTYTFCVTNEGEALQSLTIFFESESSASGANSLQTASSSSSADSSQEQYSLTSTHKLSGSACAWANGDQSGNNYAHYVFNQCSFKGTNFTDTDFSHATIQHTDMTGANFTGTNLTKCKLSDVGDLTTNINLAGAQGYIPDYYCRADSPIEQCNPTAFTVKNFSDLIAQKECPSADYPSCDFESAYISGRDLSDAHLKTINFSGATIDFGNFRSSDLSEADFSGATIQNSDFRGADLSSAKLNDAKISDTDMSGANMSSADLTGTKFDNTWLSGVLYNGNSYCEDGSKDTCNPADYSADEVQYLLTNKECPPANPTCDFPNLFLIDEDLSGIDLSNANLTGSWFESVNFTNANLNGVTGVSNWGGHSIFKGVTWINGKYCMATSTPGVCEQAAYTGADVQALIANNSAEAGSDFTGVYLSGEQFWQGLFDSVVFNEADFSNATIKDTSMRDCQFQNATFHGAAIALVDFSYSQFPGASFNNAIFADQTSFKHAVFSKATFQNADFRSVLLDGATFDETDFTYSTVNMEELLTNSQISGKTTMPNGTVCEGLAECIQLCTSANNYCEWHP